MNDSWSTKDHQLSKVLHVQAQLFNRGQPIGKEILQGQIRDRLVHPERLRDKLVQIERFKDKLVRIERLRDKLLNLGEPIDKRLNPEP